MDILTSAGSHELATFVKLRFEIRLKASYYDNNVAKLAKVCEGIPTAVWLPDFSQKFLNTLNKVSKRVDKLDYDRYGWLKSNDIEIINSMSVPLGGEVEASAVPESINIETAKANGVLSTREKVMALLLCLCAAILSCFGYVHTKLRKEHEELYMEKMSYRSNYELSGFGGGGGNTRKLIGKMWQGVKNAIHTTSNSGVDPDIESIVRGKGKDRSGSDRSGGVIGNSIQSLSSIITGATNPRHVDPAHPHRNYNAKYKYERVDRDDAAGVQMTQSMGGRGPELVVAGEDSEESEESSTTEEEDEYADTALSRKELRSLNDN